MDSKDIKLKKQKILRIKNKLNDLIILEKNKHCYFLIACFKKDTFINTTENTRKRYLLKYLTLTNGNYIITKQLNKDKTKEHYNIIVNSEYKILLNKFLYRFTDTIGTINKTYIESKNKKMENILYFLNKLLGKSYKEYIKNNIEINETIFNKAHDTELNKTTNQLNQLKKEFLYLQYQNNKKDIEQINIKKDNLKNEIIKLSNKENELIKNNCEQIKNINKKLKNFKGLKPTKKTQTLKILIQTLETLRTDIKNNIYLNKFTKAEIQEKKTEIDTIRKEIEKLKNSKE